MAGDRDTSVDFQVPLSELLPPFPPNVPYFTLENMDTVL
jgi:hypothetical protein